MCGFHDRWSPWFTLVTRLRSPKWSCNGLHHVICTQTDHINSNHLVNVTNGFEIIYMFRSGLSGLVNWTAKTECIRLYDPRCVRQHSSFNCWSFPVTLDTLVNLSYPFLDLDHGCEPYRNTSISTTIVFIHVHLDMNNHIHYRNCNLTVSLSFIAKHI